MWVRQVEVLMFEVVRRLVAFAQVRDATAVARR